MISLIIVCHNGQRFLKRLFESIFSQSFKNFEVILIDTSSTDNSVKWTNKNYPKVITKTVSNLGYGYACNQGVDLAKGKYVCFFNEDMYLPSDFLFKMMSFLKTIKGSKIGAVGCKIIDFDTNPKNYPLNFGGTVDIFGFTQPNKNPDKIFAVNGCPFLMEKSIFQKIHGFNKNIFLYNEDIDLAWRLKLFGYENFMNNNTWVYHYGGGAIGKMNPLKMANVIYGTLVTIFTNFHLITFIFVLPLYILQFLILIFAIISTTGFNINYQLEILKKFSDFFINFKEIYRFRKFVQGKRMLSDFRIFSYISPYPSLLYNLLKRK